MNLRNLSILCIFFLLHFFPTQLISQNKISDFKNQLQVTISDSTRCRLLREMGVEYAKTNRDSAVVYLKQSLELAQKKAIALQESKTLTELAYVYSNKFSDEISALAYLKKGIEVATPINDYRDLAFDYGRIGIIMKNQKQPNPEELVLTAIDYAEKSGDIVAISFHNNVLAQFYTDNKEFAQAESIFLKMLEFTKNKDSKEWLRQSASYSDMLEKQGRVNEAKVNYENAFNYINENHVIPDDFIKAVVIFQIQSKTKHYDLMEETLNKYNALNNRRNTPDSSELFELYLILKNAYSEQGDYRKAYLYLQKSVECQNTINIHRFTENTQIETVKIKAALDIAKKEEELRTQKRFVIVIAIFLLLSIAFSYFISRTLKRIEQQKLELTKVNKTKDQLLSIIAHNLRSPVNLLKESFDLLENNLQTPEQTVQFLSKSKSQIERVNFTLENLLTWTVAQRDGFKPTFEIVSMSDIIAQQIESLHDFSNKKGINLLNDTLKDLFVWGDKYLLSIGLYNVLHNAIKFSLQGGNVEIISEKNDSDKITLKIIDNGQGISPEMLRKFENNEPILSTLGTAKEKGTGLGLSLVREIVEQNGGLIHIHSNGQGTTVSIILKTA